MGTSAFELTLWKFTVTTCLSFGESGQMTLELISRKPEEFLGEEEGLGGSIGSK